MFSLPENQLASRTVIITVKQLLTHSVEQSVVGPFSTTNKSVKQSVNDSVIQSCLVSRSVIHSNSQHVILSRVLETFGNVVNQFKDQLVNRLFVQSYSISQSTSQPVNQSRVSKSQLVSQAVSQSVNHLIYLVNHLTIGSVSVSFIQLKVQSVRL